MKEITSNESEENGAFQGGIVDQHQDTVILNDENIEDWLQNKSNLSGNLTSAETCSTLNLVKNCNVHVNTTLKDTIISPQLFSNLSTTSRVEGNIEDTNNIGSLFEGLCTSTVVLNSTNVFSSEISCDKLSDASDQYYLPVETNIISPVPKERHKWPFVKISKDCLLKGKILGKSDTMSLLTKNNGCSFLSHPPNNNIERTSSQEYDSSLEESFNSDEIILRSLILNPKDLNQCDASLKCNLMGADRKSEGIVHLKDMREEHKQMRIHVSSPNSKASSININSLVAEKNKKKRKPSCSKKSSRSVPLAFVKISSNNMDNTTEILIRTGEGDNVYKGKTITDLTKSTCQINDGHSIDGPTAQKPILPIPSDKNYSEAAVNQLFVSLLGVSEEVLDCYEGTLPLHCPVLECTFTNPKGSCLKLHILQHYGIRPFKCDFPACTWAFYTSFRLKRHKNVHFKKKEFKCPLEKCGRSFSTIYNLNAHSKLHERPFSVVCSIDECNRAFQTRKSYERHLRDHGIDHAPYKCDKCGNRYFTINSLNSHGQIHKHKIEQLQCSYCSKIFDHPCRLKAHLNSHTGTKPYKCNVCSWAFTTSSKLRRHERKHNQNRKYVCKVCGKTYLRAEHLKDHSHHHFVKKSFVCPEPDCNLVLSNKSSMYSHLKRHRTGTIKALNPVNFCCPVLGCDILFKKKDHLQSHLQDEHVAENHVSESSEDAEHIISEENLSTFEGLHNNNTSSSGPGFVSFNSTSQEGLLVGMSDIVQCIPPMEQGDFSESNSSSNIITQVVFAHHIGDEENASEESQVLTEIEDEMGSAPTGLVFEALSDFKDDAPTASLTPIPTTPRHTASDVVLSAASQDSLLQDELSEADLYLGAEEGLGELQVLLLDPATRMQHSDFEQSTINLRDLE